MALVELQLYRLPGGAVDGSGEGSQGCSGTWVMCPSVVARTVEGVRAGGRVEAGGQQAVRVAVDLSEEKDATTHRRPTGDEFSAELAKKVAQAELDTAKRRWAELLDATLRQAHVCLAEKLPRIDPIPGTPRDTSAPWDRKRRG